MAPPTFADLGKSSRDLFSKGYNFGFVKLETTTKSGDVEFKTGAAHNVASAVLGGNLDIKYKLPKYGLTVTEKWNTDNVLGTEVVVQDKGMSGLKVTVDSHYQPATAKRSGKVKMDFTKDRVRTTLDANLDPNPIVNAAVVAEHEGWLLGAHGGFDTKKNTLRSSGLALGRNQGDYSLHTYVNDGSEYGGNLYHRVNGRLELGAQVGWTSGEKATNFGLAAKYQFAPETVLRAKLSNKSQVGVAMTHDLADGFKLTLSGLCSMANFQEGGHKFGLGLEYVG